MIRNIIVLNEGDTVDTDMLPPPLNDLTQNIKMRTMPMPVAVPELMINTSPAPTHDDPLSVHQTIPSTESITNGHIQPLWITEKSVIERAIALCNGNIPQAAAQLEVSPSTIYRKKQQWDSME